ncbi:LysR family transcriptional regulator [Pigmentiphaga litoralis]|uniref:LysR family transcriptional regulator n=1 Tax=Pigmentiphaga litoralis TaxID=516702 RepID=UPI00389B287C
MILVLLEGVMGLHGLDLNFLLVFEALWETRSVSRASEKLALSQPATSHALAKMRTLFDDPLFVRVKNDMHPTPRAIEMAGPIQQVLEVTRLKILSTQPFDAARAGKTFTFCMTDVGETAYLPAIVDEVRRTAPDVRLKTVSPIAAKIEETLESGVVDLALGYFPDLKNQGMFQQNILRTSGFVCLSDKDHPRLQNGQLSMEGFMESTHVAIKTEGRSQEVIDRTMQDLKIRRRIFLVLPHFLSLLSLIPNTTLVAIIPMDVSLAFKNNPRLRTHPLPFPSPTVDITQVWHAKHHKDASNLWLRTLVRRVLKHR